MTESCKCCLKISCGLSEGDTEIVPDSEIRISYQHMDKIKFCFPDLPFEDSESEVKLCNECSEFLKGAFTFKQRYLESTNSFSIIQGIKTEEETYEFEETLEEIYAEDIFKDEKPDIMEEIQSPIKVQSPVVRIRKQKPKKPPKRKPIVSSKNKVMETEFVNVQNSPENSDDDDHSYSKRDENPKTLKFGCGYCGDTFKLKRDLHLHLQTHIADNLQECDHCLEYFQGEDELQDHLDKAHQNPIPASDADVQEPQVQAPKKKVKRYKCRYCDKEYVIRAACLAHAETHLTAPVPKMCKFCNKCFATKKNLDDHERVHTGEKPYLCNICGKSFRQRAHLMIHNQHHANVRRFTCTHCPKSFRFWRTLMQHESKHPGPNRPFKCQFCDAAFSQEKFLRRHEEDHQKPVVTFPCQFCHNTYKTKGTLKTHERLHTGEKPYECGYCLKTFSDSSTYRMHIFSHTNEKPHRCDICERCYRSHASLVVHKRTHTGEMPYTCQYCPMVFRSRAVRRRHEMKIHEKSRN